MQYKGDLFFSLVLTFMSRAGGPPDDGAGSMDEEKLAEPSSGLSVHTQSHSDHPSIALLSAVKAACAPGNDHTNCSTLEEKSLGAQEEREGQ